MIDFTNCPARNKTYAGANGSKMCVVYNGEQYMLKFPALPIKNKQISYTNGCISEYLGCHIFESVGIPVQETVLGTYTKAGKEKVVVACKDLTAGGLVLQDFASLKNTIIDSERNGYGIELDDIMRTINEQTAINPRILKEHFWNVFIIDALIGNWDRHNGNWGFLYNNNTDEVEIAPIFDCGSCLFPQVDEKIMQSVLENQSERDLRVFDIPLSAIKVDDKKIKYFDFISSLENDDCNRALKRMVPRIDIKEICTIVDETPLATDLQKRFYKTMLTERKEKILDFSFQKLCKEKNEHSAKQ